MGRRTRVAIAKKGELQNSITPEQLFGSPNQEWKAKLKACLHQLNRSSSQSFQQLKEKRLRGEIPLNCFPSVQTPDQFNYKFIVVQQPEPVNECLKILYSMAGDFIEGIIQDILKIEAPSYLVFLCVVADAYSVIQNMISVITNMFSQDQAWISAGMMSKIFLEQLLDWEKVSRATAQLNKDVPYEIAMKKHLSNIRQEIAKAIENVSIRMNSDCQRFDHILQFFSTKIPNLSYLNPFELLNRPESKKPLRKQQVRHDSSESASETSRDNQHLQQKTVEEIVSYINGQTEQAKKKRRRRRNKRNESPDDRNSTDEDDVNVVEEFRQRLDGMRLSKHRVKPNVSTAWLKSLSDQVKASRTT